MKAKRVNQRCQEFKVTEVGTCSKYYKLSYRIMIFNTNSAHAWFIQTIELLVSLSSLCIHIEKNVIPGRTERSREVTGAL